MSYAKIIWVLCALGMAFLNLQDGSSARRDGIVLMLAAVFLVFLTVDLVGQARKRKNR